MQHARFSKGTSPNPDELSRFLRHKHLDASTGRMAAGQANLVVGSAAAGTTLVVGKNRFTAPAIAASAARTVSDPGAHVPHRVSHAKSASDAAAFVHTVHTPPPTASSGPHLLTVWFHDLRLYTEDVVVDAAAVPGLRPGNVYELEPLHKDGDLAADRKFVFIVHKSNILEKGVQSLPAASAAGSKPKAGFQISLTSALQKQLAIPPRSAVQVRLVSEIKDVEVDAVEVYLKDINFPRDSQWSLSSSMVGTCCYIDQRVSFLGNRIGSVRCMFKNGRKLFSGYIGPETSIIFRSESAKLLFLVQLSREMWHFEENGEIMFHKLVNTLFPKIFKRWRQKHAHHSITIVLFTSVDLTQTPWTSFGGGERPAQCRDYYRVVVDQVNVFVWDKIMASLRLEFANFKRDLLLHLQGDKYQIEGEPCPSVKGNLLEAINLSLSLVCDRFRNTDLRHSINHMVVITPGTGLFDVDHDQMVETSKKMFSLDCGLDIICLSQPPLHTVPLFRYRDAQGEVRHCVPKWCDVSFYAALGTMSQWNPRCKIYELQMMGLMENEVNDIQIDRLQFKESIPIIESMDMYDECLFKPVKDRSPSRSNFKRKKEKRALIMDNVATLSLMGKNALDLQLKPPASKTNVSTTNSSVLGTVTHTSTANSALSTLYTLNKNSDEPKFGLFLPSQKLMSSTSTIKSFKSVSSLGSLHEHNKPPKKVNGSSLRNEQVVKRSNKARKRELEEAQKLKKDKKASVIEMEKAELEDHHLWMQVENPSKQQNANFAQCNRWADVFPPKIKRRNFKWRSLTAPAALPIGTTSFPSKSQLESDYTFQIYVVTLSWDNKLELKTTRELMREMIRLRLAMGFQICYGPRVERIEAERKPGGSPESIIKYFPAGDCTGVRIYMSLNDEIHRLFYDYNGSLNVQLYRKVKQEKTTKISLGSRKTGKFDVPLIRTRYADEYTPSRLKLSEINPLIFNWNQFDQLLAGYEDAMIDVSSDYHRMKFVVMPAEVPLNAFSINNEKLSDEEIRLEGLRKLISLIERGRYISSHESKTKNKKEEILPEISFYTGNLYEYLNDQAEVFEISGTRPKNSLMVSTDGLRFNTNIKLATIAQQLQSEGGIKLVDRTWHFKVHPHCFLGSDLVSWLIENFEDIDNREASAEYGQELMNEGLFRHVENRHGFLDGHYFYEFNDEFVDNTHRPKPSTTRWFRKSSVYGKDESKDIKDGVANSSFNAPLTPLTPSTPTEAKNNSDIDSSISALETPSDLRKVISHNVHHDSEASSLAESQRAKRNKTFMISTNVKYDCDPQRKSFRPELVDVHYDRVHNPEHCFHIRLQWLNTTTKFIDEVIINWSRLCERYGLKLVETPWRELCRIPELNPFHSFVDLKLAINPWTDSEFKSLDILKTSKFYFHLHFLKVSDFLLDNRGTSFFLRDHINISYSWGKSSFKYAQFIHKTGAYIVELRDNGEFFMAPNNVHILRMNTILNTITEQSGKFNVLDSQKVMLTFRENCKDEVFLRKVFREAANNYLQNDYDAAYVLGM